MQANAAPHHRIMPGARAASVVAALHVAEWSRDIPLVSLPGREACLVVRFGPAARAGLDVHALGVRQTARRKLIGAGQRTVTARLHLGAHAAVFGVPAGATAGRIVPLEDLWSHGETRRLADQLAAARDTCHAAAILERAIAARLVANAQAGPAGAQLVLSAINRLKSANVRAVARGLGVSERHLRRLFHETVGVSPKVFFRLTRFHRALRIARGNDAVRWAEIAADAGYYDQAHLIAEFRAIAGVTPRTLLAELGTMPTEL